MTKEKTEKHRRVGKKNPLKKQTYETHLLTVEFLGIIVETERANLENATPFEMLRFHLMNLHFTHDKAEALLLQSRLLPRKMKKAQEKAACAMCSELPEIRRKVSESAALVKVKSEDRAKVLEMLEWLFFMYEDSDDREAKEVLLAQQKLFGFTDEELEEQKHKRLAKAKGGTK